LSEGSLISKRSYVTVDPVTIQERVLKVCKAYDKINADKITPESHFINDLGLDSLDHVEVIMGIEDEFGYEIPDEQAEKLMRPVDIIRYISEIEGEKVAPVKD